MTKAVANIADIGTQIDTIVAECLPITSKQAQGFNEALILADGIKKMRHLFINNPSVKEKVEAMANTPLGFMTDRSPDIVKSKKNLVAYDYSQVAECCIEAMLQGYRITGNEFNMIAGRFYPAKNGKYRKIIENEDITNFSFTTSSPTFMTEQRMNYNKSETVQVAKVKCFASWMQDGASVRIGYDDDQLVFKIKANAFMGDDGVVGKALSKLFSRVLMRIEGKMIPEATDIDDTPVINEPEESLNDKLANSEENPLHKTDEWKAWEKDKAGFPDLAATMPEPTTADECIQAKAELSQLIDQQNA